MPVVPLQHHHPLRAGVRRVRAQAVEEVVVQSPPITGQELGAVFSFKHFTKLCWFADTLLETPWPNRLFMWEACLLSAREMLNN